MRSAHFVWDRNSVPLVFLPSLRPIYKFPFYYYIITHEMSLFLLYDVIPHYHNSDHFRLHPSTFRLFSKINLWIVRAERPHLLLAVTGRNIMTSFVFGTMAVTTILILELERARKDFFSCSLLSQLHFLVSFYWFGDFLKVVTGLLFKFIGNILI